MVKRFINQEKVTISKISSIQILKTYRDFFKSKSIHTITTTSRTIYKPISFAPSTITLNLHSHSWRCVTNVKSSQMAVTGVRSTKRSVMVRAPRHSPFNLHLHMISTIESKSGGGRHDGERLLRPRRRR